MSRIILVTLTLCVFCVSAFNSNSLAWDNEVTHKDLSTYAAENSGLSKNMGDYLVNLGFNNGLDEYFHWSNDKKKIREWLRDGSFYEDAGSTAQGIAGTARYGNHFHNPLKPWSEAGLDDWILLLHYTGESSLLWSQDSAKQSGLLGGDWTWQATRIYFYNALTKNTDAERQAYFAQTFRGLGHQMHLLQDTSQPDHVRNDAHPADGGGLMTGLETWTKENAEFISCLLKQHNTLPPDTLSKCQQYNISESVNIENYYPTLSIDPSAYSLDPSYYSKNLTPVALFIDTDQYNGITPSTSLSQGLAEYTNANFFSDDTIFAFESYSSNDRHYFPYPRKTSTDVSSYIAGQKSSETFTDLDGSIETGTWISKASDGEMVGHLAKSALFSRAIYNVFGEGELFYRSFYREEKCYEDYASLLLPRAVGYSAGLLNYFFRGTLAISAPSTYIYSITDGSQAPYVDNATGNQHQQFTLIKAKVKNTTPNENIGVGILQAVARYKIIPDYAPDLSNYPPDGTVMSGITYSYSVSTPIAVTSLDSSTPAEFTFDFTQSPIPAGITDLTLQVVFKGTLGNEIDTAVAVGMKDLMEPTHLAFWNLSDMFSLNYHLYTAEQIKADPTLSAQVDLNHNGIFNEPGEPYIDPYPTTFEVAFTDAPAAGPPVSTASAMLPAGRYIRLITLVDRQTNNYILSSWSIAGSTGTGSAYTVFNGVVNQTDANGVWQTPTPEDTFRYWLDADGITQNPIIQHYSEGALRCMPVSIDSTTGAHYCEYPEEESIAADKTLYPATIYFSAQ